MKPIFLLIFLSCASAYAGVGDIDQREYVDWSKYPYNQIVYFRPQQYATCTAQYVAKDIILTARHCITSNYEHDNYQNIGKTYEIQLYDGRTTNVILEQYGKDISQDWALLRISDPNFFSNNYFNVHNTTKYLSVTNAGFGYMRILSNDEIQQIKQIFTNQIGDQNRFIDFDTVLEQVQQKIQAANIPNLDDWDYSINGYRLKADTTCHLFNQQNDDDTISTTCDAWGGNSGGVYFSGNTLYGICSYGADSWVDKYNTDHAVSPKLYYKPLQEMITRSPTTTTNNNQTNTDTDNSTNTDTTINEQQEILDQVATNLESQLTTVSDMTDAEFLSFLGQTTNYSVLKENYERALEREQSKPNRILGGLAIGATGIGGMMLASGLAEQQADQAAERDMRAYLATFTCNYGAGKNIRGGETNIELPGGNDLLKLKTEYIKLANDLKLRKQQLGISPGLESNAIQDSATSGLYDDIARGKTDGTYTSLSRALSDPDGTDATNWDKQKADTKKQTKTGGVVAGVGAVGGLVGDLIINRDSDDKEKDQESD